MADLMPRIRMPKVTLPGRSDSAGRPRDKTAAATGPAAEARTKPATGAKEADGRTTEATRESSKQPTKGEEPEPSLQERMEGLQGRMAQIERKQGRLTYFGIAGIVIALLAGGAALYIGLAAKNDSATKSDVDALTKKVDALQAAATKNSKETQNALNASAAQLQASISAVQRQQSQNAASIATLQSQASAGAFGKGAAAGTTPGAASTPGATTTTTPKKP
jgi:uncharacterized protein HemX